MMDTIRKMNYFTKQDPWYNKEDKILCLALKVRFLKFGLKWLKSCSHIEQKGLKVLGWVIRYKGEFPVKHKSKQFTECKLSFIKRI